MEEGGKGEGKGKGKGPRSKARRGKGGRSRAKKRIRRVLTDRRRASGRAFGRYKGGRAI